MALEDLQYGQDLFYYAMKHGGQSSSTSDDYADVVKAAIRKNYYEILEMEPWLFSLNPTPGTIATVATQSVTINSITTDQVTLSASIATSQAGRKIYLNHEQAVYRIASHTAGTAILTLDVEWVEPSTSGAATIFQDEYDLHANALVLWGPMNIRGNSDNEIELIGERQFKARFSNGDWAVNGPPEYAREIAYGSSRTRRIQIAPSQPERCVIEYDYTQFHTLDFTGGGSGDTPLLPLANRWVIAERALWDLLRVKNNDLAAAAWNRAEDHLSVMRTRHLPRESRPKSWVRFRNNLGAG